VRHNKLAELAAKWYAAKRGTRNGVTEFAEDNIDYLFQVIQLQQLTIDDLRNSGDAHLLDEIARLKRLIQYDIDSAAASYTAAMNASKDTRGNK